MTGGAFDPDLGDQPARLLLGRIAKSERDAAFKAAEEADAAKTLAVADLVVRVATGKAFPAEIDLALEQGMIGAAEHADFLAEIERFEVDRAKAIEGMVRVNDMLARREKPDAEDPADRAAVDALFEGLAEAFADHPPEDKAWIEDDYVARAGMLPATLRDRLLGGMFSEDPAAQVAAAGRIVRLGDIEPTVGDEIPDDMLARAQAIEAFVFPGLTPARTVQLAEEKIAREEAEKAQEAQKAKEAEDEPPADDSPDLLDRLLELLFGGPAAAAEGRSPGPTSKDIEALVKRDLGDEELTAQADELGFDADVVRLLRRMLNVTPENRNEVVSEINEIFANDPLMEGAFHWVLDGIAETDDQARHDDLITGLYGNAIKGSRKPTIEEFLLDLLPIGKRGGTRRPGIGRAPRKPKKGADEPGKTGKSGSAARKQPTDPGALNIELERAVRQRGRTKVRPFDTKRANDDFINRFKKRRDTKKGEPEPHPPYRPDTKTFDFAVGSGGGNFVRLFSRKKNRVREWVMRAEDIKGLTPAQIKDRFALAVEPVFISKGDSSAGFPR